jgi:hypothetical protein
METAKVLVSEGFARPEGGLSSISDVIQTWQDSRTNTRVLSHYILEAPYTQITQSCSDILQEAGCSV